MRSEKIMAGLRFITLFTVGLLMLGCAKDQAKKAENTVRTTVSLTGSQQVPSTQSTGSGSAVLILNLDRKVMSYEISWTLGAATGRVSNIQLHGSAGGSDQMNSPAVVPIAGFQTTFTGEVKGSTRLLTDDEIRVLRAGKWYINIYSTTWPEGELRGNIRF